MSYVPARLREVIELHIYRNYATEGLGQTPLILGIDGPPGEGKTFSVSTVTQALGIREIPLSGGQLESPHSGKPAELIRDTYRLAGGTQDRAHACPPSALVINDIDGGIGDWGSSVQYTVNRQNVITELMNLCDHPTVVEGYTVSRTPIIVTGNDFSRLYGPLVRSGRFRRFTWVPTPEEKSEIVATLLPSEVRYYASTLVGNHPSAPVSFFADIVSFTKDRMIQEALHQRGFHVALAAARRGSYPKITAALTPDLLDLTASQLSQQHTNESHLR